MEKKRFDQLPQMKQYEIEGVKNHKAVLKYSIYELLENKGQILVFKATYEKMGYENQENRLTVNLRKRKGILSCF